MPIRDITEDIALIRNAVYGYEVREAIASSIEGMDGNSKEYAQQAAESAEAAAESASEVPAIRNDVNTIRSSIDHINVDIDNICSSTKSGLALVVDGLVYGDDITLVGTEYVHCTRNLYNASYGRTNNGITFTAQADGSVSVTGTATGKAYNTGSITDNNRLAYLHEGTYTISGGSEHVCLQLKLLNEDKSDYNTITLDENEKSVSFSIDSPKWAYNRLYVKTGTVIEEAEVCYPMLEIGKATHDFVKHERGSNKAYGDCDVFYSLNSSIITVVSNVNVQTYVNGVVATPAITTGDITAWLSVQYAPVDLMGNAYVVSERINCVTSEIRNGKLTFADGAGLLFSDTKSVKLDSVSITCPDVYTADNSSTSIKYDTVGVTIVNVDSVCLMNCTVEYVHTGVCVESCRNVVVQNCRMEHANCYPIVFETIHELDAEGHIIYPSSSGCDNVVVIGGCFGYAYAGIKGSRYIGSIVVDGAVLHDSGDGIDCAVVYSRKIAVTNCTLYKNKDHGMELKTLRPDIYAVDVQPDRYGIDCIVSSNNMIQQRKGCGISVQNNQVWYNDDGTLNDYGSVKAEIYGNTIICSQQYSHPIRASVGRSAVNNGNNIRIADNTVLSENTSAETPSVHGIVSYSSSPVYIYGNSVKGNFVNGVSLIKQPNRAAMTNLLVKITGNDFSIDGNVDIAYDADVYSVKTEGNTRNILNDAVIS